MKFLRILLLLLIVISSIGAVLVIETFNNHISSIKENEKNITELVFLAKKQYFKANTNLNEIEWLDSILIQDSIILRDYGFTYGFRKSTGEKISTKEILTLFKKK